jgi:hypothetical protein
MMTSKLPEVVWKSRARTREVGRIDVALPVRAMGTSPILRLTDVRPSHGFDILFHVIVKIVPIQDAREVGSGH